MQLEAFPAVVIQLLYLILKIRIQIITLSEIGNIEALNITAQCDIKNSGKLLPLFFPQNFHDLSECEGIVFPLQSLNVRSQRRFF